MSEVRLWAMMLRIETQAESSISGRMSPQTGIDAWR